MKFKLIFLLFNLLILVSFAVVIFMPFMMLGAEYSRNFWAASWYLPALFLLIIIAIDGYFFMNWRLFTLLEAENWAELLRFLEGEVMQKGKTRSAYVRALIHAYFVTGNVSKIEPLEQYLREKRPRLVRKFALEFGMPKVLHKNHADMVKFFYEFKAEKVPHQQWIRFLYAFGALMQHEHSEGREELLALSNEVREPVLKVLVLYTLDPFKTLDDEVLGRVERQRGELQKRLSAEQLRRAVDKRKDNIAIVVMTPLIQDAINWLFSQPAGGGMSDPRPDTAPGDSTDDSEENSSKE
ncbi:MAG: hypothetical protein ACOC2P_00015 [Spirochaetota bacterium]